MISELLQNHRGLLQLQSVVKSFQQECAAEVEDAQKALIFQRQERTSEDAVTNFEADV